MSKGFGSQDNFDRLLKHLKDGSLAAQLVHAYRSPGDANPAESAKALIATRLDQVRKDLDDAKT